MNNNNSEVQAPLLYGDPNTVVNGEQQPLLMDNVNGRAVSNPLINPVMSFGHSPQSNIVSIVFFLGKIIATNIILSKMAETTCQSFSLFWIIGMLFHDIMCLFIPIMRLQNLLALKRINTRSNNHTNARNPPANNIRDLEGISTEQMRIEIENIRQSYLHEEAFFKDVFQIVKTTKKVTRLSNLCIFLWSTLLFSGVYHYLFPVTVSTCKNPAADILFMVYLGIAVAWIFRHVVLIVVGCLCLPVLLILYCFFSPKPKQASNAAIKKLPIKKYSTDFPGDKECAICMVEYEQGDKVIQLECNAMHYFHEECGKKWLKINGQCPICRTRIDEKK